MADHGDCGRPATALAWQTTATAVGLRLRSHGKPRALRCRGGRHLLPRYLGHRVLARDRTRRTLPAPHALCPAGTAPPPPRQGVVEQRRRRMGAPRSRRRTSPPLRPIASTTGQAVGSTACWRPESWFCAAPPA